MLRIEDLTEEELKLVNASFFRRIHESEAKELGRIYDAYVQTLHEWGIMCPHPIEHRLYEGWQSAGSPLQHSESKWYQCGLCQAAVINRWGT